MIDTNRRSLVATLAVLLALPFVAAAPASAGTERYVTITSLPYAINTPGGYRLTGNLSLSSGIPAITINCDNVVLDLDGYTITSTNNWASGVSAIGRSNVTVRNGTLRGFVQGISMQNYPTAPNPIGIVVEDLKVLESKFGGIVLLNVNGAIVRRCNVAETISQDQPAFGIRVSGLTAQVIDNVVHRTYGPASSVTSTAIHVGECHNALVARNLVANPLPLNNLYSIGIDASAHGVMVTENRIAHFERGITYASGGTGLYSDNFVLDCWYPYTGGTDAGGNH